MADDQEISVTIDEEEKTGEGGGGNEALEDLKSQFADIQKSLDREKSAREDADRRAAQAVQDAGRAREEVRTARSEVADRELDTIVSGIAAAQAEADAAQRDYEAAAEAGDFRKQGEAQRRMAAAEAKKVRLDEGKADVELRRASDSGRGRGDTGSDRRTETRQPAGDPVESFIAGRTPQTQAWLRSHPDEARALAGYGDQRRAAKLGAAHQDAIAEGITPDTPEYFAHVERFIGMQPNGKASTQNGGGERQRRASPVTAPVSGNGSGGAGSAGATEVRLTPGEAAAAEDGSIVWGEHDFKAGRIKDKNKIGEPIGRVEFAKRKLAMKRDGRYASNFYVE